MQEIIGKALDQHWKLKAIDSIRASANCGLPQEQFHTIIDKLIADQEIKNILLKHFKSSIETKIKEIPALDLYQKK